MDLKNQSLPLPTKEEAEKIIEPITDQIRQAFRNAADDWTTLYAKMWHILSPRARAAIFHDHISFHIKTLLVNTAGIKSLVQRGIFTLCVSDAADVRFKKLDKGLRSSSVRTGQNRRYEFQLRLEGFADLPRLTAGYTLNALQTSLARMCVTLQVGRRVLYVIDLDGAVGQQLLPFPNAETPKTPHRRVRPKKEIKPAAEKE